MKDLFFMGGAGFMGILSILFVIMVLWMVYHMSRYIGGKAPSKERALRKIEQGRAIALFALICGVLSQLIGMYSAFDLIQTVGDVSPSVVMGGVKVVMITTIYGLLIYLISIILWFVGRQIIDK